MKKEARGRSKGSFRRVRSDFFTCRVCEKPFKRTNRHQRHCSPECGKMSIANSRLVPPRKKVHYELTEKGKKFFKERGLL